MSDSVFGLCSNCSRSPPGTRRRVLLRSTGQDHVCRSLAEIRFRRAETGIRTRGDPGVYAGRGTIPDHTGTVIAGIVQVPENLCYPGARHFFFKKSIPGKIIRISKWIQAVGTTSSQGLAEFPFSRLTRIMQSCRKNYALIKTLKKT